MDNFQPVLQHLRLVLEQRTKELEDEILITTVKESDFLSIRRKLGEITDIKDQQERKAREERAKKFGTRPVETQEMFHYCKTCKLNYHCKKCCPLLVKDIENSECFKCRIKGHTSKDCCMKGTLQFIENNYKKKIARIIENDSEDEKDRFKDCEEHDPNVLLMMSMDRSFKENEERQRIQMAERQANSLSKILNEKLKLSDANQYESLLENLD